MNALAEFQISVTRMTYKCSRRAAIRWLKAFHPGWAAARGEGGEVMPCRHCGKSASRLYRGYCDACVDWASHKIAEEEA